MADDIIQKAAEWDKQSSKLRKKYARVEELTNEGGYVWQPKYDGIHAIINTTDRKAATREGNELPSIQQVVNYLSSAVGTGLVFQGEVWLPGIPFKDISGAARRQSLQPQLGVVLYDCHEEALFDAGTNDTPYSCRRSDLVRLLAHVSGYPHILLGDSFPADEPPIGGWQVLAQEYVRRGGYDGLILRDTRAPWQVGTARNGELIKVKPSVTLDLRCNGVIQGEGKHAGKLGAVSVSFNGVNSCVGTGFSDQQRDEFWQAAIGNAPDDECVSPIGQIVEVECMCVNANGTLREPRFKAVRWDKKKADDDQS
jgi:DNA ligase-1